MVKFAGHDIPRIAMGVMALAIEQRPDKNTAIHTIHAALDMGVRYLDTAWSYYLPTVQPYGQESDFGYGEYIIREALKTWRGDQNEVLIATKTGWCRTLDIATGQYGWHADARVATMIRDAKESAHRLGVETIDLLYSHCNDPQLPYEDQMEALATLHQQGVIRYAGISRIGIEEIKIAQTVLGSSLIAVQNQFSPSSTDTQGTLQYCRDHGLKFVNFSPLGGFLDPFDKHCYDRCAEIGRAHGVSQQQVTLAWELAQGEHIIPIPSARNPQEIQDNYRALQLQLSDEELAYISENITVA